MFNLRNLEWNGKMKFKTQTESNMFQTGPSQADLGQVEKTGLSEDVILKL